MSGLSRILLIVLLTVLILTGCDNAIWTGQTYEGELTKTDLKTGGFYTDYYNIYCAGKWEFNFTSKDNIKIFMEGYNEISVPVFIDMGAQNGTNTFTVDLKGNTEIDIYVNALNPDWAANGYSARYSFTATLK